jgi:predicted nucleotidyltransferase
MVTASVTPTGFLISVADRLPGVVQRLVTRLEPEKIVLFGSYAYGDPTPDSDVDLLVIWQTDASPTERYLAVSRELYPRPFPVDLLVRTPQEIDQALRAGDFFIQEIMTQGHVLYARDH